MNDYFLKMMIETILPVLALGCWSLAATLSVKQMIKAVKEGDDKKMFTSIWLIAVSVVAVLHGAAK